LTALAAPFPEIAMRAVERVTLAKLVPRLLSTSFIFNFDVAQILMAELNEPSGHRTTSVTV
jgi:hypothetical protein